MSDATDQSEVPGPSEAEESIAGADTKDIEESKVQLKTAFVYCEQLLFENNHIAIEPSAVIEQEHMKIGKRLYHSILETMSENKVVIEDELIMFEEVPEEGVWEEDIEPASRSHDDDDDDYEPPEKRKTDEKEYIPLDYKIKVVNLAKMHPKWSLKVLQRNGAYRLKRMDHLKIWEEHIKNGGTTADKFIAIDSWTYDRFAEARHSNQQVTTRNLQQWALAAASQFPDLKFQASQTWVDRFKAKHRIRQRKITKFVTERETATMEETLAAAENFRMQTRALIPNYDKDFVINTDQTGCQYQSTYDRTLAERGSKVVLVKRKDMNKVTHSYTVQYAISLSGKLLPSVYVCLQETTGKFGPRVQKSVDQYAEKYTNVVITSSKSGKLTTALYRDFLTDVMRPYVKKEKFLLLIDSWGGQTNPLLYDAIFTDEEGLPSCTIKVIPPKCTPLVQPCDVYFYRQVRNLIKKLQNCSYIIDQDREINSREDCVKIQSIVHHQLSSPIFDDMLQYAWFAAKLCDDRRFFVNVNQVCFAVETLKKSCECGNSSFISCARCRNNYCFPCFYDQYHPSSCVTDNP